MLTMVKEGNYKKMTLKDYYDSLPAAIAPKTEFIKKVVDRCGVTQQAIHKWLRRGGIPSSREHCDAIAEIANIPAEELFPMYNKKYNSNDKH